jgi:hypothetical protein
VEGQAVTEQLVESSDFTSAETLPRPIQAETDAITPVTDRSFFIERTQKRLAEGLITPIDEFSGIPLPILPTKNDLPLHDPDIADWHHPFHPKEHPLLKTAGGLALRNCRVQLVHRNFHNESPLRYHKFFEGPVIPESEDEQFRTVVLAAAGYIPRRAINTRSGEPEIVDLSPQQSARLRRTMRKAVPQDDCKCDDPRRKMSFEYRNLRYSYDLVREFLSEYMMMQSTAHLPEPLVDEFLHTKNSFKLVELGDRLLALQAEFTADKVESSYRSAQQRRQLHPLMPKTATEFVHYKLGNKQSRQKLYPRLFGQLAFNYGLKGLTIRGGQAII